MSLTYWLPKVSNWFGIQSTIEIQPLHSLDEVDKLPVMLLEATDIQFEILRDNNDSEQVNNYLARLFQPDFEDD